MTRNKKQMFVCVIFLVIGAALIIGGIYLPPLLIPGVPIFVGGLGSLAAIIEDKDKIAFHTTINNINNYGSDGQKTVTTERVRARFNFGPSVARRINEWGDRMREVLEDAPPELRLEEAIAPVLTFTNNYHAHHIPTLTIEDVTDNNSERDSESSGPHPVA